MNLLVAIIVCVIAISIGVIAVVGIHLKNRSNELSEKLSHISSYSEKSNYEQAKEIFSDFLKKIGKIFARLKNSY